MKSLLAIVLFFMYTTASDAQVLISLIFGDELNSGNVEFGLDGGLNWTDIKGIDQSKYLFGWNLGFYFDIKLSDPDWFINTGVVVKGNMGAEGLPVYKLNRQDLDELFADGSVTRKLNYFSVPVTIKYRFNNNIFVKAGIQLGLMYNGYDTFIKSVQSDEDLTYEIKIKDQYHPLDAGIAVGAGYRLLSGDGINLGITYYQGFIDVRIDDSSPAEYNSAIYLNAGIPIGK